MAVKEKTLSLKAFLDTTGFTKPLAEMKKELDGAGKEFRVSASEAKAFGTKTDELKNKAKYLSDTIGRQGKLVEVLKEAYEKARRETGEGSKATSKLKDEVDKARIKYNNLHSELKDVNRALDANEKEIQDVNHSLDENQEELDKSAGGWQDWVTGGLLAGGTAGIVMKAIGALGGALGTMGDLAKGAFDALKTGASIALGAVNSLAKATAKITMDSAVRADEAATMAAKMGLTVEKIQELQYAVPLVDVELETMASSLSKLTGSVRAADKQQKDYNTKIQEFHKNSKKAKPVLGEMASAFTELKIPLVDAKGNFRDMNDIWEDALQALEQVNNETERDILAQKLFGKSFAELKPMIAAGMGAMKKYGKEAHQVGFVMTKEQIKNLTELDDSYNRFQGTMTGIGNTIGSAVAPAFKTIFDTISDNAPHIQKELTPAMKDLGEALGDAVKDIAPHIPSLISAGTRFIPLLTDGIKALTPSIEKISVKAPSMLNGIANAFEKMPEGTIEKFGDFAVNGFGALADAAVLSADPISKMVQTVADNSDGLLDIIEVAAVNAPILLNNFSKLADVVLPKIAKYGPPLVDMFGSILGYLTMIADLLAGGSLNQFFGNKTGGMGGGANIPGMATGGVSPGGMTMVGEKGPELQILPRGTRIFSASETRAMLSGSDSRKVVHSGMIRIEGVNSQGQLEGVVDYVMDRVVDRLAMEARL